VCSWWQPFYLIALLLSVVAFIIAFSFTPLAFPADSLKFQLQFAGCCLLFLLITGGRRAALAFLTAALAIGCHCVLHTPTGGERTAARATMMAQRTPVARVLKAVSEADASSRAAQRERQRAEEQPGLVAADDGRHRAAAGDAAAALQRRQRALSLKEKFKLWRDEWKARVEGGVWR
jgi:hypothetical protein